MPRAKPEVGERYHIYNRGLEKRVLFFDEADYARMLFYILFLQSPVPLYNIPRIIAGFRKNNIFPVSPAIGGRIIEKRMVELECFSLMPNHLHLIMHELQKGGISSYMQRVQIAYTKYFNTRYKRSGYLLQGPYQAVHVSTNEQFLHLSAYIHRNARELPKWRSREHVYPWSSYQDYILENRWGPLLAFKAIAEQFSGLDEYKNFTDSSNTKNDEDDNYWTSDVR
jgi:putative transposase